MKNKNYDTVGIDPKSHWKIVETGAQLIPIAHMTSHFQDMVHILPNKWGVDLVLLAQINTIHCNVLSKL